MMGKWREKQSAEGEKKSWPAARDLVNRSCDV